MKCNWLSRAWHALLCWLCLPDAVYYINGPETLPPPLTPAEEKLVFAGLEEGRQSCRDILITHNLRLVVYIAKKFEGSNVSVEDIISIGTIGLIKAVNTFAPSKNIKLATYASRCIENEILMYLRKSSNRRQEASIDEPLNTDGDGNENAADSFSIGTTATATNCFSRMCWAVTRTRSAPNWSRTRKKTCCVRRWPGWPPGSGRSCRCALV